jgi:hypothetical protein
VAGFYSARSETIPPLPWPNFAPPFPPDTSRFTRYNEMMGGLYTQVLRPLVWTGLFQETRLNGSFRAQDSLFTKIPLWKAALKLDTDSMVRSATRH